MTEKTYFSQVEDFLHLESDAIRRTASRLKREDVERAIEILVACRGKVVFFGVGKSGVIGAKVAATMTSTATPALSLHPSDALHGGLGLVTPQDVVIAISNSGETDEIVQLLPALKQRRVPLIAIIGDLRSTLGRAADVALDASVDREACPLNLAPTASTTVALAIGDALAMTLMAAKNMTTQEFAFNHPAGRIGKRLTLRVGDLMHKDAYNPVIHLQATWIETLQAISRGGLGATNVVDEAGQLIGIITDGDVRRAIERAGAASLSSLTSDQIMTREPIVVTPDLLAYEALRLMEDRPSQISVLPVVDDARRCIGLIRLHDIVRSGL
ncbi:MAG: KpsF/GutQ family sugar-phosphate isomerase [Pyrinomonadaceae bacterium]|nr:KpsF/GutQ family sugar-phosphate isomerase [Pyrinomonadaceae bacterium]